MTSKFSLLIIMIVVVLYSFFIEPYNVRSRIVTIRNKTMASTFKNINMIHLSDLHIGDSLSPAHKQTLEMIEKMKPDLIFLTGDYVSWKGGDKAYENVFSFFSQLDAPLGVYAVMGDSDYNDSRKSCEYCHLKNSGLPTTLHKVKFLRNSKVILKYKGNEFAVAGIDGHNKLRAINKLQTDIPSIFLCHTSLIYRNIDSAGNTLVLSGDTHGGQIYLPQMIWRILKRKPDPKHIYGLFQEQNKFLYVTSGIGTSDIPVRLGVPPEIVLFEFSE